MKPAVEPKLYGYFLPCVSMCWIRLDCLGVIHFYSDYLNLVRLSLSSNSDVFLNKQMPGPGQYRPFEPSDPVKKTVFP